MWSPDSSGWARKTKEGESWAKTGALSKTGTRKGEGRAKTGALSKTGTKVVSFPDRIFRTRQKNRSGELHRNAGTLFFLI